MKRSCKICKKKVRLFYDVRVQLVTEIVVQNDVKFPPPKGCTKRRLKRRRSYARRVESFAWRLYVTEVTSTSPDETAVGKRALVQRYPS